MATNAQIAAKVDVATFAKQTQPRSSTDPFIQELKRRMHEFDRQHAARTEDRRRHVEEMEAE